MLTWPVAVAARPLSFSVRSRGKTAPFFSHHPALTSRSTAPRPPSLRSASPFLETRAGPLPAPPARRTRDRRRPARCFSRTKARLRSGWREIGRSPACLERAQIFRLQKEAGRRRDQEFALADRLSTVARPASHRGNQSPAEKPLSSCPMVLARIFVSPDCASPRAIRLPVFGSTQTGRLALLGRWLVGPHRVARKKTRSASNHKDWTVLFKKQACRPENREQAPLPLSPGPEARVCRAPSGHWLPASEIVADSQVGRFSPPFLGSSAQN